MSPPVRATVRVPATSANLGPGFDALGLALDLHDEVSAEVTAEGLRIEAEGEGAATLPRDESHLIVAAMRRTWAELDETVPGLILRGHNRIPHGRGLGSSAAAICAGVLLARELSQDGRERLEDAAVLNLCAEIEGHSDNVAACLLGGLTVAWTEPGRRRAVRLDVTAQVQPIVLVPPQGSSTAAARRLLPAVVPHADAAFNAARAALLVAALTGGSAGTGDTTLTGDAGDALLAATADRLHQPYRASAMPGSADLVRDLRADGVSAVISGAGPTVLALTTSPEQAEAVLGVAPKGWWAAALAVAAAGAQVDRH
ncbi:MAG: homoserine kinase [bacterium]